MDEHLGNVPDDVRTIILWLRTVLTTGVISEAEASAMMASSLRARIGPTEVSRGLAQLSRALMPPIEIASVVHDESTDLYTFRLVDRKQCVLETSARIVEGLLEALDLRIVIGEAKSIRDLEQAVSQWNTLGEETSICIQDLSGDVIAATHEEDVLSVGSTVKLFILAATVEGMSDASRQRWNLAARKSPAADVEPEGPEPSFEDAFRMIAFSDNDAADRLVQWLGSNVMEQKLTSLGMMEASRNSPFLTMAEMTALKTHPNRQLVKDFLAGSATRRVTLRSSLLPSDNTPPVTWSDPVDIHRLGWFASAADLARCMKRLDALANGDAGPALKTIMGSNRGISLDRQEWPVVWFKGGGEPGVLAVVWLAKRKDGHAFILTAIANSPTHVIDGIKAIEILVSVFAQLAVKP